MTVTRAWQDWCFSHSRVQKMQLFRPALAMTLLTALMAISAGIARAQTIWPADNPESWGLAIVDVETTGLDPAYHEMVDLGVIYTDIDGAELGRLFVRIMPDHPERTEPAAAAVNGFSEARWRELGAVSTAEAAAALLTFHAKMAENHPAPDGTGRVWLFTAYNAWFDRVFVDALLTRNGSSIRELYNYFQLDLPSMAWGAGIPDLKNGKVAAALGLDDETSDPLEHTGISGAEWNLDIYRALRARSRGD